MLYHISRNKKMWNSEDFFASGKNLSCAQSQESQKVPNSRLTGGTENPNLKAMSTITPTHIHHPVKPGITPARVGAHA
jgi:hypothetical protein